MPNIVAMAMFEERESVTSSSVNALQRKLSPAIAHTTRSTLSYSRHLSDRGMAIITSQIHRILFTNIDAVLAPD
jgi:hypothetical protein